MNRLAVPFVAFLSFSLLHCAVAAETNAPSGSEEADVAVQSESAPDALSATAVGEIAAEGTTVDDATAAKGKTKGGGAQQQEYMIIKMNEVFVSSVY